MNVFRFGGPLKDSRAIPSRVGDEESAYLDIAQQRIPRSARNDM
jgi:hypothetical protein